mgnify:CR=1 FL=1
MNEEIGTGMRKYHPLPKIFRKPWTTFLGQHNSKANPTLM